MTDTIKDILIELKRIKKATPNYPNHICGKVALIAGKVGRISSLSVIDKYRNIPTKEAMIKSAKKTAAECIRFIESLEKE